MKAERKEDGNISITMTEEEADMLKKMIVNTSVNQRETLFGKSIIKGNIDVFDLLFTALLDYSEGELKNCPICNCIAEEFNSCWDYYVRCTECELQTRSFKTRKEANEAWNKRYEEGLNTTA